MKIICGWHNLKLGLRDNNCNWNAWKVLTHTPILQVTLKISARELSENDVIHVKNTGLQVRASWVLAQKLLATAPFVPKQSVIGRPAAILQDQKKKKSITVWKQKRVLLVLLKKSIARKNELQHKLSCKVSRVSSDQIKWSHLSFKLFIEEKTTSYFERSKEQYMEGLEGSKRNILQKSHSYVLVIFDIFAQRGKNKTLMSVDWSLKIILLHRHKRTLISFKLQKHNNITERVTRIHQTAQWGW